MCVLKQHLAVAHSEKSFNFELAAKQAVCGLNFRQLNCNVVVIVVVEAYLARSAEIGKEEALTMGQLKRFVRLVE